MRKSARSGLRKALEKEIGSEVYRKSFQQVKATCRDLEAFDDWREVIIFAKSRRVEEAAKDALLDELLLRTSCSRSPNISAVLILMFWNRLYGLVLRCKSWDHDGEELWHNLLLQFLQSIETFGGGRQVEHVMRWICNRTRYRLHEMYQKRWAVEAQEDCYPSLKLERLAGSALDPAFAKIENRDEFETAVRSFHRHVEEGRLSETDFLILVATRFYGLPLKDYARDTGLDYEMAKKRKQRAEARLGISEEKS